MKITNEAQEVIASGISIMFICIGIGIMCFFMVL